MADPTIARELTSLRDEIAAAQRTRPSAAGATAATAAQAAAGAAPDEGAPHPAGQSETGFEKQVNDLVHELVDEATHFFDEAEKNIAAHPTASVVGALVVGFLLGSMLRRH